MGAHARLLYITEFVELYLRNACSDRLAPAAACGSPLVYDGVRDPVGSGTCQNVNRRNMLRPSALARLGHWPLHGIFLLYTVLCRVCRIVPDGVVPWSCPSHGSSFAVLNIAGFVEMSVMEADFGLRPSLGLEHWLSYAKAQSIPVHCTTPILESVL